MQISPIPHKRALKIDLERETIVAATDLHLGITSELSDKGIEIPSRVPEVRDRLLDIIENEDVDRLFFLGDVKHNIPVTSMQEWESLPKFFKILSNKVKVDIVPGNHDGDIEGMISREVKLHDANGKTVGEGRVGLLHGHAWPSPELMNTETIIMGHNHPTIEFRDEVNARVTEPAWVKTRLKPENLPQELRKEVDERDIEVIIVPAFSKLVGGGRINRQIPEKFLGPMFTSNAIELEEAEIRLLDGTLLGKLDDLREQNSEKSI
ncbi:hypothetical protein AKJ52_01570 [candidate division MSBL1 archaeon SCGC-AAA382C18]|uniref:Calcineurin-like phosphoesterase domain-containing protein n=1 Tax=candidate division MSBL1 archaeon SCGC-AAA382C18 TaxID=1698281 RepID=A0A133VK44_9EURY|nr:hypothetical protein AKJ52_01570 [candidate division MSBL1 archaeon SCGC-AAA382C18]